MKSITLSIFLLLICLGSETSDAHDPHDVIDGVSIWESNQTGPAMLIIEAHYRLLYSTDEGASWKQLVNGLDNRFAFTDIGIGISRHKPSTLFVSTDGDGVFKSNDEGQTWKRINRGLDNYHVGFLAVSPNYHQRKLLFAACSAGGLYRSNNGGLSWDRVIGDSTPISAIAFIKRPEGIAIERILAGTSDGQILSSNDSGKRWQHLVRLTGSGAITDIEVPPAFQTSQIMFVGSLNAGVFRSDDGGRSFVPANEGLSDTSVVSVVVSPEFINNSTVYAAGWNKAVFKSIDGGRTWKHYSRGLTKSIQAEKPNFFSPHFRKIKILRSPETQDETLFLTAFDGLFKSSDSGKSWSQLDTEPPGLIWRLSVSPAAENDFLIALTTQGAGAYFIRNSKLAWDIRNIGLIKPRLGPVVFSPDFFADRTVYCIVDEGYDLLKSINGGEKWIRISLKPGGVSAYKRRLLYYLRKKGLPESLANRLLSEEEKIRIHPKGIAISPNYTSDGTLFVATRRAGLYKTTDGAKTIMRMKEGLKEIWSIVLSPNFKSDQTIFATARQKGVYKSVDAGQNWKTINGGLNFLDSWQNYFGDSIQKQRENARSLYYNLKLSLSPDFQNDQTVFLAGGEELYKSLDGGANWKRLEPGVFGKPAHIQALSISPDYKEDHTLMVSIKGKGLIKSNNGGESFSAVGHELIKNNHSIQHIVFSPLYYLDKTILAASEEHLFESQDSGVSWCRVQRPVRYENNTNRHAISYHGKWKKRYNRRFSSGYAHFSASQNSKVIFNFVGTGARFIGPQSSDLGRGTIFLDDKFVSNFSQSAPTEKDITVLYSIADLNYGHHRIRIEVVGNKDSDSNGKGIAIDAFDVIGSQKDPIKTCLADH